MEKIKNWWNGKDEEKKSFIALFVLASCCLLGIGGLTILLFARGEINMVMNTLLPTAIIAFGLLIGGILIVVLPLYLAINKKIKDSNPKVKSSVRK